MGADTRKRDDHAIRLYLVVICTVCAFFIQPWAIRPASPSRVSALRGAGPLWAAAIGITIAHDTIAPAGYVGICLILAGIAWGRSGEQGHRPRAIRFHRPRSV